jgi:hypothetical protein
MDGCVGVMLLNTVATVDLAHPVTGHTQGGPPCHRSPSLGGQLGHPLIIRNTNEIRLSIRKIPNERSGGPKCHRSQPAWAKHDK